MSAIVSVCECYSECMRATVTASECYSERMSVLMSVCEYHYMVGYHSLMSS